VKWLIGKEDARVQDGMPVANTQDARNVIEQLGSEPIHLGGDRFKARPSGNVPEDEKSSAAQKRSRSKNIRKAQAAGQKKLPTRRANRA